MRRSVRFAVALGLGVAILLVAREAGAQYRYADANGVSKVVQYKLDVPAAQREYQKAQQASELERQRLSRRPRADPASR